MLNMVACFTIKGLKYVKRPVQIRHKSLARSLRDISRQFVKGTGEKTMSDDVKWDCETCTYKNFQASKKCVMCNASRPLQVITDLENSEQDIYKVAELDALNTGNASSREIENKWSCNFCTVLNWTNTPKCVSCLMPRKQRVISPSNSITDFTNSPTIRKQPTSSVSLPSSGRITPISKISPTSPGSSQGKGSELNKSVAAYVKNTIKWICNACTYENYPQSKKCSLCSTPQGQKYTIQEHNWSELEVSLQVDTKNQENIRSGQNSPVSAKYSVSSHDLNSANRNKSGQASPSSLSGLTSPNNNNRTIRSPSASGQTSPKNNNRTVKSPSNNSVNKLSNEDQIIPYSSSGQSSPNNQSGRGSPKNNIISGHISPQEITSGLSSPLGSGSGQSSPLTARASHDKRCQGRNEPLMQDNGAGAIGGNTEEDIREKRIHKLRKKLRKDDIIWLRACEAVVKGDPGGIEQFLTSGGDPARQLTKDEVLMLNRPSAFEVGHTLVHLALRFRRDDMVAILLTTTDIASKGFKRLPSYTSPDLAAEIRREISMNLRQRKGHFPCYFISDIATFSLPAEIEYLPRHVQTQLFDENLDSDVYKELADEFIVNWSLELTEKLGSRLYALWNRTAGDCLLDSVLQATWGVLDIDNTLRQALSDSLSEAANKFYPRWKEYESMQAHTMHYQFRYSLEEEQLQRDWAVLLSLANQPGASLEQMHIFVLAHILRRPIIVYGVKIVKSYKGENIDYARFEGVYLPLLWERNFCYKTPIALGYTRGHFSALVPMEVETDMPLGAGAHIDNAVDEQIAYLPLVDNEEHFLPIHFVTETCQEETMLRKWMDCFVTQDGLFVAIQKVGKRSLAVRQMIEVWLDYYRHEANLSEDLDHGIASHTQSCYLDADSEED